ncbi:MAG TPA: alpha-L-fucosidase, partial [Mucilaginibacter sp.]|nr:alpha-L-fucosidase [Mucilaginibacter sp.]
MKRRSLIKGLATALPALWMHKTFGAVHFPAYNNQTRIADGPFKPSWDSLKQYQVPDWFRDAKFGIWAHWGPQCQP